MNAVSRRVLNEVLELRLQIDKTNALNADAVRDLHTALGEAEAGAKAVVLVGGERFFCNGLDVGWALRLPRDALRDFFTELGDLVLRMIEGPVPIVGAARGHAIGAGKTLLAACDHRVMATGRALLGAPEVKLGVPNPYFADQLLRLIVGDGEASRLIYDGTLFGAERGVVNGLVHDAVPSEEVEPRAHARAIELAALPRGAFAASKRMRSEEVADCIRTNTPTKIEELLDNWFGIEAQTLLRAAAARAR